MGILKGILGLPDLSGLVVLVVDEAVAVRHQLRATLLELGARYVETANSVSEAQRKVDKGPIDLIFCNYDQGTGTTGQEWMEELKDSAAPSQQAGFVMLSADKHYSKTAESAEVPPDALLLKPFTTSDVLSLLSRLVSKRKTFSPLYRALTESPASAQAVLERLCRTAGASNRPHYSETAQLLAKLYDRTGQRAELASFYTEVIRDKGLPWAKLGRAQLLEKTGDMGQAETAFTQVVSDHPTYLAAYQATAQFFGARGAADKALAFAEAALKISPNSLKRLKQAGELALANGDTEKASRYLECALRASASTAQADARLEFQLAMAQLSQQRFKEALGMVQAMKKRNSEGESRVYALLAESAVLYAQGVVDQACDQFTEVVQTLHTAKMSITASVDCLTGIAFAWCARTRSKLVAPVKRLVHRLVNSNRVSERVQDAVKYAPADLKQCVAECSQDLISWTNAGVQLMAAKKPEEAARHLARVGLLTGNSRLLLTAVNACTKAWAARAEEGLKKLAHECLDRLDIDLDTAVRERLLTAFR